MPDGEQDRQAALSADDAKNVQACEIGEGQHSDETLGHGGRGDMGEGESLYGIYNLNEEEEEVSACQVEDVDGEDILLHAAAQKPQHNSISCEPDEGNYNDQQVLDLDAYGDSWKADTVTFIL